MSCCLVEKLLATELHTWSLDAMAANLTTDNLNFLCGAQLFIFNSFLDFFSYFNFLELNWASVFEFQKH